MSGPRQRRDSLVPEFDPKTVTKVSIVEGRWTVDVRISREALATTHGLGYYYTRPRLGRWEVFVYGEGVQNISKKDRDALEAVIIAKFTHLMQKQLVANGDPVVAAIRAFDRLTVE